MPNSKFVFVETLPVGSSKREHEIQQSQIRSHAASMSFQKPKAKLRRDSSISTPDLPIHALTSAGTSYGLVTPPESPERRSSDAVTQPWSEGTLNAAFLAGGRGTIPDQHETLEEGHGRIKEEGEDEDEDEPLRKVGSSLTFSNSAAMADHQAFYGPIPSDLCGIRTDPFNCIPARGSRSVATVVDYHAQIMAPNHAPIYKIFNVTNVYTSYYFELLQNEDFMFTGVASVQAIIDQLRIPGQKPSANVLRHMGMAMSKLRRRLARPGATADDLTIITVLFLAVVARAIGDMESHEVHKKSVGNLVASRGGLDMLGHGGLAQCTLMQWESFWALNSGTTMFPHARPAYNPSYPVPPFTPDIVRLIAKLPCGFQTLAKHNRLAIDVLEVLERTTDAEALHRAKGTIVEPADVFRSRPRRYHDFWEACTCLGAPDDPVSGEPNLEKLIVLALLIYSLHTFSPMRAVTAVYNGSRTKLAADVHRRIKRSPLRWSIYGYGRRAHRNSDNDEDDEDNDDHDDNDNNSVPRHTAEEECLVWIWMVLVDAWRASDDRLLPQGKLLMAQLARRYDGDDGGGIRSRSERFKASIDPVLSKFFYNNKFAARCRGYCDDVSQVINHG